MTVLEIMALAGPVLVLVMALGMVKFLDLQDRREAAKQAGASPPKA